MYQVALGLLIKLTFVQLQFYYVYIDEDHLYLNNLMINVDLQPRRNIRDLTFLIVNNMKHHKEEQFLYIKPEQCHTVVPVKKKTISVKTIIILVNCLDKMGTSTQNPMIILN